ncbi:MAG: sporulation protein YqfD, partial [Anaerotignaceae bacterium]
MFLRLWNYFNGYVIISVVGFSVERFINLAAIRGIYIWNIKKEKNRTTMNVSLRGFKKLKECGKKTKCRFKIIDKKGVPFVINKGKRRQVYTGGIFLFVCIIYILSTFTWTVSVEGNSRIPTEDILSFCTEQGLYAGSLKFKTDKREITKKLISNFPEISWVAINTKGTAVTITVVEIIEKTEFVDRLTPTS